MLLFDFSPNSSIHGNKRYTINISPHQAIISHLMRNINNTNSEYYSRKSLNDPLNYYNLRAQSH